MHMNRLALAAAAIVACAASFYPAASLPARRRAVVLIVLLAIVLLAPALVPLRAPLSRALAAILAVTVGAKMWDLHLGRLAGERPGALLYLLNLTNPFAIVLRRIGRGARRPRSADLVRLLAGMAGAGVLAWCLVRLFHVDWHAYPFALQHAAKVIPLFGVILLFGNAMAAGYRWAGLPAIDFSGNFFVAPTPAEFWRTYNRPAAQFFRYDVFDLLGGPRHPATGLLLTFGVSGLIHEYIFDMAAARGFGIQMAFFMTHGLAALVTARARPRGWAALPAVLLTFAFNLTTAALFFASVNLVVPFYQ